MPISYVLDGPSRRVRTTVAGPVTVEDILNHLQAAWRDELLPLAELIDARRAARPILSVKDMQVAADRIRAMEFDRHTLGPRAVVVEDLAMFGVVRVFVALVSDLFLMNVFRDLRDAENWLAEQESGRNR